MPGPRYVRAPVRVRTYIAQSLDGRIADAAGGVGWLEAFDAAEGDHGYAAFMAEVGPVAMGAATFELAAGFDPWPYAGRPTWVFAHAERPAPAGADVRFVAGAVGRALGEIEAAGGGDLYLVGGGDLIAQFLAAGRLDEAIVFTAPVVLGGGPPLLPPGVAASAELEAARGWPSGLVEARYRFRWGGRPGRPAPGAAS